jgi:hypothetical protein
MSEQHEIRTIWRWRDKAHHYRGLASLTHSRELRDLLLDLASEAEAQADQMETERQVDSTEA